MDIKNPQNLKKALAIVSTSTLLAAFGTPSVVPVAKPAVVYAAGAEVDTVTSVPTIRDTVHNAELATIRIKFTAGTVLKAGDFVIVELPNDFTFASDVNGPENKNVISLSGKDFATGGKFAGKTVSDLFDIEGGKADSDRVVIRVKSEADLQAAIGANSIVFDDDAYLYISLGDIDVEGAEGGPADVELTTASTGSAFPQGKVTVANVVGSGEVQLSVVDDMTSSNEFTTVVRIKEATAGSLEKDDETLKFTLPDGYKWKGIKVDSSGTVDEDGKAIAGDGDIVHVPAINGQDVFFRVHIDDDELKLELVAVDLNNSGDYMTVVNGKEIPDIAGDKNDNGVLDENEGDDPNDTEKETEAVTRVASIWELPLLFEVDDETKVKPGDVIVQVSGETDTNVSELVVGKYGDYSATVSVDSVKTLYAGQDDQELGVITIKESVARSLIEGRTITLTLPDGARWQEEFEAATDEDPQTTASNADASWTTEQSGGLKLKFSGYTGTDYRTAKFTVDKESNSKEGYVKLKNVKIAVAPYFEGPIEIEVGGTAGVTGTVKVADVVKPVDVEVENQRDVIIGADNQIAGDLVITEKEAGVLDDDDGDSLIVELPDGVKFTKLPKVEVTSGDVKLGTAKLINSDTKLEIPVERTSTKPSTIRISDIQLKVDRTVPEGALNVEIKGDAVLTTHIYEDWKGQNYVAKAAIANVVTPAPDAQKATVVFTVDNTKYTVNGVEKTADVAPYIKDGRTFLPVRYVAEALGVSSDNILWDAATKTVTLFKGDRVVKLKIGSKVLYVNGTAINMDVAPEIKNGRTMLPLRWVGTALGVTVEWDEEARTVTVKQ